MKLELTKKHARCIDEAISQANLSPCAQKHGCVIAGNGKIYSRGYNNYRTRFANGISKNCTSCHAEIMALQNFYQFKHNSHIKVAEEQDFICC